MRRTSYLPAGSVIAVVFAVSPIIVGGCADAVSPSWDILRTDASGPLEITANPLTGTPSFIRTDITTRNVGMLGLSGGSLGYALANRYADVFGLKDARSVLQLTEDGVDGLGMRHLRFKQTHRGIPVYGAEISFHVDSPGRAVTAVTSSLIPHLKLGNTRARVSARAAMRVARERWNADVDSIALVIYPGRARVSDSQLAWLVELRDDMQPLRRTVFINARTGRLIDSIDQIYYERDRRTHSAENGAALPGKLRRGERDRKTGDADVDKAHQFIGETYDYFLATHGRDSYDGRGAELTSTVHYRINFQNAFWNGTQMAYGDGFAVKDVAAHELTHAVTEHSARLEYRWQSGALNESFSDIFGAMVDRDDWLIGEDLPNGPIRNMEDPTQFNHPAHANDWRAMCGDNEGVHINSGIHNKAFVTVAEAIGKETAERIFYRSLTVYLGSQATFEDSRAGALQSATDLFGEDSPETRAVDQGFTSVGINGSFDPGPGGCGGGSPSDLMNLLWIAMALVLGVIGAATTIGGHWRSHE
jgi:Zn-dependent metalloprotease